MREPLVRLYGAIREVSGCEVIVDSSKFPWYGLVLAALPDFDVRVLHLVRDSRGVAFSEMRRKQDRTGHFMKQKGPMETALFWSLNNVSARVLGWRASDYIRLRYEDFVTDPEDALREILARFDGLDRDFGFLDGDTVELGVNHTVAGNPIRFDSGPVALSLDLEWREAMSRTDRVATTAATWPLLAMYGYQL